MLDFIGFLETHDREKGVCACDHLLFKRLFLLGIFSV